MGNPVTRQLDMLYGCVDGEVAAYRSMPQERSTLRSSAADRPRPKAEQRPAARPATSKPRIAGPPETDHWVYLSCKELDAIRARHLREESVAAYHASEQARRERNAMERET